MKPKSFSTFDKYWSYTVKWLYADKNIPPKTNTVRSTTKTYMCILIKAECNKPQNVSRKKIILTIQLQLHCLKQNVPPSYDEKNFENRLKFDEIIVTRGWHVLRNTVYTVLCIQESPTAGCKMCDQKWVTNMAAAYKTYGKSRQQRAYFSTQKTN